MKMHFRPPTSDLRLLLSIAFFILIGCLLLNGKFNWVDDAYYIMLGKALAGGFGYKDINLPEPTLHRFFPPGLPILLTLPSMLGFSFDAKIIIFKLILIACGALALYFFSRLAIEEGYEERSVIAAVALSAVSIAFVGYTYRVAAEMLYALLTIFALLAARRYERSSPLSRWLFISAALTAAAIFTRTVGIVLLGAMAASWILKRDLNGLKRAALLLAATAAVIAPWFIAARGTGAGTGRYVEDMLIQYRSQNSSEDLTTLFIKQAIDNSREIVEREMPRIVLSISASEFVSSRALLDKIFAPVRLGISLLTLLPLLFRLWPKPGAVPLYLLFYLGLLAVWPWEPSRFLIPIIPFLCLLFAEGLQAFIERTLNFVSGSKEQFVKIWAPRLFAVAAAVCIASHLISDARFVVAVRRDGDFTPQAAAVWNDTIAAYDWLKRSAPSTSVIGCAPTLEAHLHLFTGLKAVGLTTQPEACRKLNLTHIIRVNDGPINRTGEGRAESDLKTLIKRAGGKDFLAVVYENPNAVIYSVDQSRLAVLLGETQ